MSDTGDTSLPDPQIKVPRPRWWARSIGAVRRKFQERREKIKHESDAVRAARRATNATIWMAIFTVVLAVVSFSTLLVLKKQLGEMQSGGVDTKKLATAADNQANWTQSLAISAGSQADRTKDLADRMKDQADQTKVIATQAKVSADAAKSAANTAQASFEVGTRPWVGLDDSAIPITAGPVVFSEEYATTSGTIKIKAFGEHVASGVLPHLSLVVTGDLDQMRQIQKSGCENLGYGSPVGSLLFPGQTTTNPIPLPFFSRSQIRRNPAPNDDGSLEFWLVGCINYRGQDTKKTFRTRLAFWLTKDGKNPVLIQNPQTGIKIMGQWELWENEDTDSASIPNPQDEQNRHNQSRKPN